MMQAPTKSLIDAMKDEKESLQKEILAITTTLESKLLSKEIRMQHKTRLANLSYRIAVLTPDINEHKVTLNCSTCDNQERLRISDYEKRFAGKDFRCMCCLLEEIEARS